MEMSICHWRLGETNSIGAQYISRKWRPSSTNGDQVWKTGKEPRTETCLSRELIPWESEGVIVSHFIYAFLLVLVSPIFSLRGCVEGASCLAVYIKNNSPQLKCPILEGKHNSGCACVRGFFSGKTVTKKTVTVLPAGTHAHPELRNITLGFSNIFSNIFSLPGPSAAQKP